MISHLKEAMLLTLPGWVSALQMRTSCLVALLCGSAMLTFSSLIEPLRAVATQVAFARQPQRREVGGGSARGRGAAHCRPAVPGLGLGCYRLGGARGARGPACCGRAAGP